MEGYSSLIKSIEDEPKGVYKREASKGLARFVSLHPYSIAQKNEVIVEF